MTWLKKNITISVLFTLLAGYGAGAMAYAVMKSDISDLKLKVFSLPERLARLEEKVDSANEKVDGVSKGVDFLIKRELGK